MATTKQWPSTAIAGPALTGPHDMKVELQGPEVKAGELVKVLLHFNSQTVVEAEVLASIWSPEWRLWTPIVRAQHPQHDRPQLFALYRPRWPKDDGIWDWQFTRGWGRRGEEPTMEAALDAMIACRMEPGGTVTRI